MSDTFTDKGIWQYQDSQISPIALIYIIKTLYNGLNSFNNVVLILKL